MAGITCIVFTHERNAVPVAIKHTVEPGEDKC